MWRAGMWQDGFQELRGVAFLGLGDLFGGAGGEDLTALATSLGTHVDDPVGESDDIEVVLDDDDGVAAIHEFL